MIFLLTCSSPTLTFRDFCQDSGKIFHDDFTNQCIIQTDVLQDLAKKNFHDLGKIFRGG